MDLNELEKRKKEDEHPVLYPSVLRTFQVIRILTFGIALTVVDELFTVIDEKTGAVHDTIYSVPFLGAHPVWYSWKILFVTLIVIFITSEVVSSYYLYVPRNLQKTKHAVLLTMVATCLGILATIISLNLRW